MWAERAGAARGDHPHERVAYGPGPREVLDLFTPERQPDAPVAVFLHGGYWQALDGAAFHGIASALLSHGVAVAIPTYDLAPAVSLGRILRQVRTATDLIRERTGYRPLVFGHSAGGHLTAMTMVTDWPSFEKGLPVDLVSGGLPISGVYDVEPIRLTPLNDAVRMKAEDVAALSPMFMEPATLAPAIVAFGGAESAEFHRHANDLAGAWGAHGVPTEVLEIPGRNHFTALSALAETEEPLFQAALKLLKLKG